MKPLVLCLIASLAVACSDDPLPPPPAAQPAPAPAVIPPKAAAAEPVPEAKPNPDADLAARVKRALEAVSGEIAQGVDVAAENGVVRLFGTVRSSKERSAAGKAAASTPGVTSVENKLVVVKGS